MQDRDGCLSPTEVTNLFSVCPIMPWGPEVNNTVVTNSHGWITHHGYLAEWTWVTALFISSEVDRLILRQLSALVFVLTS